MPSGATPTPGVATPLPPSARVANAAGKAISHAVLAGVEGTRQVGHLGYWFLVTADRFDAWLYGKRAQVVSVFAFLTVVVTTVEQHDNPRAPLFTAVTTGLFSLLLFLLGVARIGALRGDDGSWSFGLAADRVATAWQGVAEQFSAFGDMKGPEQAKALGRGLMVIALVGLALRNIALLLSIMADEFFALTVDVARSIDETMMTAGHWALGAGLILWILGWLRLRTSPESKRLLLDAREREQLRAVASALPAVIDCSDRARTLELAGRIGHPVMKALLEVLVTWQPRGAENEADYQASLFRKLRREMPGANPERERPIGDRAQGTNGRADLVVSDSVLIEMKKGLTTTTAQRALGQIQMYLRAWDRGPVMLLVCEADAATVQTFLAREIEEIRRRAPVLMVLAGRR